MLNRSVVQVFFFSQSDVNYTAACVIFNKNGASHKKYLRPKSRPEVLIFFFAYAHQSFITISRNYNLGQCSS